MISIPWRSSLQSDIHDRHIHRVRRIKKVRRRNRVFCDRGTSWLVDTDFDSIPSVSEIRDQPYRILSPIDFENGDFAVSIYFIARWMFDRAFQLRVKYGLRGTTLCLHPTQSPLIYLRQNSHIPNTLCREYSSGYGLA
jgi:hypothetical protein